jgi:acetyltransferase-like isoleucine patch superfamily enzyme/dTDP-4-dehydrorhamnose 3,5-epimerase-like enzyme
MIREDESTVCVLHPFVHPQALVEAGARIGARTRIWAFAHVLPGACIGEDCNICDHTFIENDVVIGDRVTVKCGVYIWDGIKIQDDVFVGPGVAFTNDKFPRSKHYPERYARTLVGRGASLGAHATVLPGLRIGAQAMVGAGAVVTRDVPPNAIVIGNPARIVGYVDAAARRPTSSGVPDTAEAARVQGVRLICLHHVEDMRGDLCVSEWYRDLPFVPRRVFMVYHVPDTRVRGEHAHRECHEFLTCVNGSMAIVVDDGSNREEYVLDRPWVGIYLPPRVWRIHYKYSPDAVSVVLASHEYDAADYVRDYAEFLELRRSQ